MQQVNSVPFSHGVNRRRKPGPILGPAWLALLVLSLVGALGRADIDPKYYAVEVSAQVQSAPPQITLVWEKDGNASVYTISRRSSSAAGWSTLGTVAGNATQFADGTVSEGVAYEYQISKATSAGYAGFGYLLAGINAPFAEDRGKVVLLVDNLYASDLADGLSQLQRDLVADGWTVLRHDVSRNDSPANIKRIIQSDYASDPAHVRAVFLFGHIPVAYSGNLNPDGHPNHQGAWPTDAFYADMDGSWTDNAVNNTSAERQANWNVPGDSKFDQSEIPSDLELEVGRVDLSNLTCFSNKTPSRSERDLLRQYLSKDHRFRTGQLHVERRGIVCDNFGEKEGEAYASSGWRNLAAFFGSEKVSSVPGWNYFSTVGSQSYLWSYGCGGGGYYTCDGVGSSDDFATGDPQTVFTMFLGSYFGDWDNESNFLRAPLGSASSILTVSWAGRPHCFYHHMALGETIGHSIRLSQNNPYGGAYSPQNHGTRGIHLSLMGDPTLRMHPVMPPSNVQGSATGAGLTLSWSPSPDSDLLGYHVYRAASAEGPFVRISGNAPVAGLSFADTAAGAGSATYLVRAIKLERSGGGTYLNPSEGVFYGANLAGGSGSGSVPTIPAAPVSLAATAWAPGQVDLSWEALSNAQLGFQLQRRTGPNGAFQTVATLAGDARTFRDTGLAAGMVYGYRIAAYNDAGLSSFSNAASITTAGAPAKAASALFIGMDEWTRGDWNSSYGREGYRIVGDSESYAAYASISTAGASEWTWAPATSDPRALQKRLQTDRVAACWFANDGFMVDVDLRDGQPHRVAIYCLDWDSAGRKETVEVLDASTGVILSRQSVSSFGGGIYLVWNVTGHVVLRIAANLSSNAAVSGLFLDPSASAVETAATPAISPNGGAFSQPVTVALTSATPNATIRFTLDGTEPNAASAKYSAPFLFSGNATLKAKAFKDGLAESVTATANFSSTAVLSGDAQARFLGADNLTRGNWRGAYGSEGFNVIGDNSGPPIYPAYAQITPNRAARYIWSDSTVDARAPLKAYSSDRVAACWYADDALSLDVNFTDNRPHRLTLYFLDWDTHARRQTVELFDATTGKLLNSQAVFGFNAGMYFSWEIKGRVLVRLSHAAGNNAVLMGLFLDPPR